MTEPNGTQRLRAAVRDTPGQTTEALARGAGIGRPTASALLNRWRDRGEVRQAANPGGRGVVWFDASAIDLDAALAAAGSAPH